MQRLCVAIHPDDYSSSPEKPDGASSRWAAGINEAGHTVKWVDVRRADILDQIRGCHGFMWRWNHMQGMSRIARRLLPVIERELRLPVYPDQSTCWHYDDKIAQRYLLEAVEVPMPKTWVWFDKAAALLWAEGASYPLVLKLATGAASMNVVLVRDRAEAVLWISRLFGRRVTSLESNQFKMNWKRRVRGFARYLLHETPDSCWDDGYEPQSGYALFQEFLPANEFDHRITVIGKRAFAYRRFNRPNDFRASGSGNFCVDPTKIDERMIRTAFQTARALSSQSCAVDGLYRGQEAVIAEVSYTYVSWMVHACPGHWELIGDPCTGSLKWHRGQMWPEEAQLQDFLSRLQSCWANRAKDR
jgi:hypothetical protein